jgi:hypothetical protein
MRLDIECDLSCRKGGRFDEEGEKYTVDVWILTGTNRVRFDLIKVECRYGEAVKAFNVNIGFVNMIVDAALLRWLKLSAPDEESVEDWLWACVDRELEI